MIHRGKLSTFLAVGGCLAVSGLFVGITKFGGGSGTSQLYAQQTVSAELAKRELARADELSGAFRKVAKALKPSVVSITATKKVGGGLRGGLNQGLPPGIPEEFRRFFGEEFEQFGAPQPKGRPRQMQPQEDDMQDQEVPAGLGSGVIISADGYILTNNHVIAQADGLKVTFSDGREMDVEKVVGADEKIDLAVLKVNASGLAPASLGDSDAMEVGDWVVAIGSPFGLAQTVTQGIVSATNRSDMQITSYDDFIQTDAAINPGNSGGPLLNLSGEVIGINTAIASRSGSYNGIGFAIPSNKVRRVAESLIRNGRMIRGFVGLSLAPLDRERLEKEKLPTDLRGVMIDDVYPEGPAAKAGLQKSDVVTSIDNKDVDSVPALRHYIADLSPGATVEFHILRGGKKEEIKVTVEEQTDDKLLAMGSGGIQLPGLQLEPSSPELAAEYNLPENAKGLVVTGIASNGPFGSLLSLGDLIVSVNGKPVGKVADMAVALRQGRSLKMEVMNQEGRRVVELRIGN